MQTIEVIRRMRYLCGECDIPVVKIEERTVEGVKHQCPRCGVEYMLERSYPYEEFVMEPYVDAV